eukprot:CAMPEP_0179060360 /NCGR_PEP_ID=MMETSP0796-20121207/25827_1 /TAXON_ID=73915 /ORGANISM="Pyrodinium bahamense, Strain pbaha01" /LENGTH=481 /DNA_ID=CAMNT_0020757143 /DNA_START=87 /DNA_END=1532 /DNA_ORIENTATION=+
MAKNPRVYLDIAIGNRAGGRVLFELFADVTPRTAENFRGLCTGEYGQGRTTKRPLSYIGCSFFRSVKGVLVQSGDFQFNNGDGGESVYGGTFNDEDFSRRHTQGGILSMANRGRNSNGSQFFITLKRHPLLDGKHIVFGQVIGGMDVIRAIGQVPTDRDEKPRVPVTIVGSGEVGRANKSPANLHVQMEKHIADLNEELAPSGLKVPEAVKAKAILAGKQGGAVVLDSAPADRHLENRGEREDVTEDQEGTTTAPARNERERRLLELRLKMNQCRASNSKEVVEEQKRAADPDYAKRRAGEQQQQQQQQQQQLERNGKAGGQEANGEASQQRQLPKGKEHLLDTVETVEMRDAKRKKGNPDAFGWDVFNQDSLLRAHEKRLKHISFDEKAYKEQKDKLQEDTSLFAGFGYKPTEEAKDRLQAAIEKIHEKKKEFSRRRDYCAEEDVTYINERNRHFNRKMQRAFGAYTEEIRQNLERGTAL